MNGKKSTARNDNLRHTREFRSTADYIPADTRCCWIDVGLMLVHRLRRGTNVKSTLIQSFLSAGIAIKPYCVFFHVLLSWLYNNANHLLPHIFAKMRFSYIKKYDIAMCKFFYAATNGCLCMRVLFEILHHDGKNKLEFEEYVLVRNWHKEQFLTNTRHWANVVSMLARRLRRRPNINPTLVQCLVFAGLTLHCQKYRVTLP